MMQNIFLAMDRGLNKRSGGAWLALSVERATFHLGIVGSSPTLGVEITL